MLAQAMAAGLASAGVDVEHVDVLPTPGLAFLTAAFVIVAVSLGYLVFTAIRRQVETETTMEARYQALDKNTQAILKPFVDRNNELANKIAALEAQAAAAAEAEEGDGN